MDSAYLRALTAYNQRLQTIDSKSAAISPADNEKDQGNFASLVADALTSTQQSQQTAENLQIASLRGEQVELSQLITAVSNAEIMLNTVVTVRDRMISAYQEIARMPI